MDKLLPLIGVFIGGIITYFSTRAADKRIWKQEREARLSDRKREALEQAFSWLTPFDIAIRKAKGCMRLHNKNHIDNGELIDRWPKVLDSLNDVPEHLKAFLPENAYKIGLEIVDKLEELKILGLAIDKNDSKFDIKKLIVDQEQLFIEMKDDLSALRQELEREYKSTL